MGDLNLDSSLKHHGETKEVSEVAENKDSKTEFSEDEEMLMARMFKLVGPRWSLIAGRIPGRTAEEIEKHWNSNRSLATKIEHLDLKFQQSTKDD